MSKTFVVTAVILYFFNMVTSGAEMVKLQSADGCNSWWHAFKLLNVDSTVTISKVYLSNADNGWFEGSITNWDSSMYEWKFGELGSKTTWNLPYNVKIVTSDGQMIEKYGVITNRYNKATFEMGDTFERVSSESAPAPGPASGPSSSDNNDYVTIKLGDGCNEWWHALKLLNVDSSVTISSVYLSNSETEWLQGHIASWDSSMWEWHFSSLVGKSLNLPYNIKIVTTDLQMIEKYGIITKRDSGSEFSMGAKFNKVELGSERVSSDKSVKVESASGCNTWWYGLKITNIDSSLSISNVYLSNSDNDWMNGRITDWDKDVYEFEFGERQNKQWYLPYNIKIVGSNGNIITSYSLINSFSQTTFDTKQTLTSSSRRRLMEAQL